MPFGDTPAFDRGIDRGFMMPVGELITSAVSNKGNPTGILQDNTFRVKPDQDVRIVDKSGQVLFSGVGPEAARQAVAIGQNLSDTLGNKAGWTIQTGERAITDTGEPQTYFYDVANEKVNKNILGKIADVALPIAASFIPGVGPVLGAALGSTASSVAQGRGIGETLLRAGLSAGGSALGGQILGRAVPTEGVVAPTTSLAGDALSNLPSLLDDIAATAAQNVASAGLSTAAQAVAPSIAGDILATAIREAAPSAVGSAVGSAAANVAPSLVTPPAQVTQPAQTEQPLEAGPEIVATAPTGAQIPVVTPLIPDVAPLEKFTPTETLLKDVAMGPEQKSLLDRLTANMGLTDYLTLASLVGSAGAGLFGGGSDTGTAEPYVSPFGPGMGAGGLPTGPSRQLNPAIADYERYGFGPEALFFAPQSNVVAPTTTGPAGAMVNPRYEPLI